LSVLLSLSEPIAVAYHDVKDANKASFRLHSCRAKDKMFESRFPSCFDADFGEATGMKAETTSYGGGASDKARCGRIDMSQGKVKLSLPQFLSFVFIFFRGGRTFFRQKHVICRHDSL